MNKPEINYINTADVDIDLLTPSMQHYVATKRENPDCILLYRLGDFFETFFEDAVTMSKVLEITLTSRDAGKAIGKVPLAGIPIKSTDAYIEKLIQKNYKVAICDQLEDPKEAKGLVKRGVTRVITSARAQYWKATFWRRILTIISAHCFTMKKQICTAFPTRIFQPVNIRLRREILT